MSNFLSDLSSNKKSSALSVTIANSMRFVRQTIICGEFGNSQHVCKRRQKINCVAIFSSHFLENLMMPLKTLLKCHCSTSSAHPDALRLRILIERSNEHHQKFNTRDHCVTSGSKRVKHRNKKKNY